MKIACKKCQWQPDGKAHWQCSCGHKWNTFDTKGKCLACETQWEDTWCPACSESSPHISWYHTDEALEDLYNSEDSRLVKIKNAIEQELQRLGIHNYRISNLSYLEHQGEQFHAPFDAGCRMIILYSLAYLAHNPEQRPHFIEWFKQEGIWDKVSPNEQQFLQEANLPEKVLAAYSWRMEGALSLAWCLGLLDELPALDETDTENAFDNFQDKLPELGGSLTPFLPNLKYRNLDEVYQEAVLNELVTAYSRDQYLRQEEYNLEADLQVNYERFQVLNWLRTHYAGPDGTPAQLWDDVDLST